MNVAEFDAIVIGAGVIGSAAAFHLARDGRRVLLLEQFEIAHSRGSSHGESRIFRYGYPNPAYVRLAIQSDTLWRDLEAEAGEQLLLRTGGLDLAEEPLRQSEVTAVAAALSAENCRWEQLDRAALARRFPQWRLSEEAIAVYSPDAGVLSATRAVQIMVARAAAHGAMVRDREPVLRLIPGASGVEIETAVGRYRGSHLVVAAGAWTNRLLAAFGIDLPLQISQEQTAYFKPRANPATFVPDRFPVWIHHRDPVAYGFPIVGAAGVKVAFHRDGPVIELDDYKQEPRPAVTARLRAYLERYLPGAAGEPFDATTCLYTNTPDGDFVVGTLPGRPDVAVAAGFSGHGFKFAIGIGRALADLVQNGQTEMEIYHLALDRFRGL